MTAPIQPVASSPLPPWLQGLLDWAQSRSDVSGINSSRRPPELRAAGGAAGAAHSPMDVVAAVRPDALPVRPSASEQRIRAQITGVPAQVAASTQTLLPEQIGQHGNLTPLNIDEVITNLTGIRRGLGRNPSLVDRGSQALAMATMFAPALFEGLRGGGMLAEAATATAPDWTVLSSAARGEAPAVGALNLDVPTFMRQGYKAARSPATLDAPAFLRRSQPNLGSERGMIGPLYHGSPHDFNAFDISHIGTGEGAAAYGHGLYFSSAKDVGEFYRNQLAGQPEIRRLRLGGLEIGPHNNFDYSPKGNTLEENIRSSLAEDLLLDQQTLTANGPKGAQQHALDLLDHRIEAYKTEWPEGVAPAQRLRKQLARKGAVSLEMVEHPGKLYTVDVDAHPEQLLDWDKPLSEQSPQVRAAVHEALGPEVGKVEAKDGLQLAGGGTLRIVEDPDFGKRYWMEIGGDTFRLAEKDIPNLLGQGTEGRSIYQQLATKFGSDKAASDYLHERGLKGIRYLDANSRDAGAAVKTHNYVVFHHDPIKIKSKGSAAVGMLAGTAAASGAALAGGLTLEARLRKQIGSPPKR